MRDNKVYAVTLSPLGAMVRDVASGLREPVGVAFRNGALYVSAISRILRYDDFERRLEYPPVAGARCWSPTTLRGYLPHPLSR